MQVAGGLANRQCTKSSGGLPCLPVFTDALSHTVQLVYTSSGPGDPQSYLRVFLDHNPQPVLTTFINIDDCAVSSADHLLCASHTLHAAPAVFVFSPAASAATSVSLSAKAKMRAPSFLRTCSSPPVAVS
jgi:hypothetical protein